MRVSIQSRPAVPAVPAFAGKAVLAIAGTVALVQFAGGFAGGYWFDEAYMLAIGREHLDWGSADQPPVAPALAALLDLIAPGSIWALRIPAVLATAAAVVVAALIAREFGGDRRAQLLTAGAQATLLWVTMSGHWLTPYTLEPVQWLLILWLLVRWVRVRADRLLLALGAVAGVAAETKFQVLLLCALLLLSVLICGPRALLRRPLLWAGAGIGLLIALPTLWWQATHDWPQLRMGSVVTAEAEVLYGGRPGVAVTLLVIAGVAGTVLSVYGVWRLLRADEMRAYRFLGVTAVALFVVFVVATGRPYYLGGLYGALCAAGALGFQRRRENGGRYGWVVWPAYALSAVLAGGMAVIGAGAADPQEAQDISARAENAYRTLPTEDRDNTVVMGTSYIVAAYLDVYSAELPPAYSTNRSYGYFPPPPESARDVLYVGPGPDELRDHFASCRIVIDNETGSDASSADETVADEQRVWLCRDRQVPWQELWPRLRHLDVG